MSRRTGALVSDDRRARILELVNRQGSVRIGEISDLFDVANETARRDLDTLADSGFLRRTHGGALSTSTREESDFGRRLSERLAEKEAIAIAALDLVLDGGTILLDSGTTVVQLAKRLSAKRDILVVTNSVPNLVELQGVQNVSVVMTGGLVRHDTLDAVGDLAVSTLRNFRVDHAFISIHAVTIEDGLMYPRLEEVAVKQAMIESGVEVTLLADASKLGRNAFVKVAPITALTRIITSEGARPEFVRAAEDLGIEVVITTVSG